MKQTFQTRVNANPQWKAQYGNLLNDLQAAYAELKPLWPCKGLLFGDQQQD